MTVEGPLTADSLSVDNDADVGGNLADLLLVDALDVYTGTFDGEGDAGRGRHHHRVGEAERELQVRALHLRAVADALDFEHFGETGRNAGHHVVQERAGEPVEGPLLAFVVRAGDVDDAFVAVERDARRELAGELTLRALHGDGVALADRDGHVRGDGNGLAANARHRLFPYHT